MGSIPSWDANEVIKLFWSKLLVLIPLRLIVTTDSVGVEDGPVLPPESHALKINFWIFSFWPLLIIIEFNYIIFNNI